MFKHSIFLFISIAFVLGHPQQNKSDHGAEASHYNDDWVAENVTVKFYYESLCPYCIEEYPHFVTLVEKLVAYINLTTYPYGNAQMQQEDGKTIVECQHGENECYGNKLHACAIDLLNHNVSLYVKYVACLMQRSSNDAAVEECTKSQNLPMDPKIVMACAKGERGQELLIYYGELSEQVSYNGVPYILINDKAKADEEDLMRAVCDAFKNPPDVCNLITDSSE